MEILTSWFTKTSHECFYLNLSSSFETLTHRVQWAQKLLHSDREEAFFFLSEPGHKESDSITPWISSLTSETGPCISVIRCATYFLPPEAHFHRTQHRRMRTFYQHGQDKQILWQKIGQTIRWFIMSEARTAPETTVVKTEVLFAVNTVKNWTQEECGPKTE